MTAAAVSRPKSVACDAQRIETPAVRKSEHVEKCITAWTTFHEPRTRQLFAAGKLNPKRGVR